MIMEDNMVNHNVEYSRKVRISLVMIFFLAVSLRCIMPCYLMKTNNYYRDYMISSSHSFDLIALSIALAKGERFHNDYFSYAVNLKEIRTLELDKIQREDTGRRFHLNKGGMGQFLISSLITRMIGSFNIPVIQIFQGIIDSFCCLFVYGIICFFYGKRVGLIGALLYAVHPAFIFYAYHLMSEAYIPFFMLAIGYTFIASLIKDKSIWFGLTGIIIGLSFSFRTDNLLILPIYCSFILFYYRSNLFVGLSRATLLIIFCIFTILPFMLLNSNKQENAPILGVALYNSLGEYPGNYEGLRFFHDQETLTYGLKKVDEYISKKDPIFQAMLLIPPYRSLTDEKDKANLITLAYIKEVIIERPFLFINQIASRFLVYLPSHPFIACIVFYLKTKTMMGYRFSDLFHCVKYIDYILFIFFCFGCWVSRNNMKLLSLLCIYFGVLISHVILGGGEVYYRLDKEFVYLDPRYLLGMIAIWPVFIAISIANIVKLSPKLLPTDSQ